ncbi:MAG TPA: 16S rRNA (adenine(1518)-N(6)/adenine(1519)-N(6))-dimethyltransferase RsmA [Gemmatimonadales bacterium]|jgi:16S rRNA (adenine1518-N6/adenine1519-N6)-dimethyltransferase
MLHPRKSLGQHFLTDRALLARIAAATGAGPDHVVLEVGPGPGGLTAALLDRGAAVVAIERDDRMSAALSRRFAGAPFVLAVGDALELDWHELVAPMTAAGKPWIVAGNIPYNITSPLIAKALTPPLPESVTYLVQREVADRIVAEPGTSAYGALTIGVQAVATAASEFTVEKGAFTPRPKVDSAVVRLVPRDPPLVSPDRIAAFRRLVTSLFSYRRKQMVRALREARGVSADEAVAQLGCAGIDPGIRPEDVDIGGFIALLGCLGPARLP